MRDHHGAPVCSIIIPAYNEETTIGVTLRSLTQRMQPGEFDIIVVCNGCKDQTAAAARDTELNIRVVETPIASKTAALNLGIKSAYIFPVVFLDADIKTSSAAVRSLIQGLKSNAHDMAYGQAYFHTNQSNCFVRAFYRAWQLNPYFDAGKIGGFFAISANGMNRVGKFPTLTNDDEYIRRKMNGNARFVPQAKYIIEAPRTIISLVGVRSRVYRGNRELHNSGIRPNDVSPSRFLWRVVRNPKAWFGALVFAFVAVVSHARNWFPKYDVHWEQDRTARLVKKQGA